MSFIPGMFPVGVMGEPIMPPSFVAATDAQIGSGTSLTIAKPTGTIEGDILLCYVIAEDEMIGDMLPSGFTELQKTESHNYALAFRVGWKLAGSSEPANYTCTVSTGGGAHMSSWRDAGTPIIQSIGFPLRISQSNTVKFPKVAKSALVTCVLGDTTTSKVPSANAGWDYAAAFDDTNEHGGWFAYAIDASTNPTFTVSATNNPVNMSASVVVPPKGVNLKPRSALIGRAVHGTSQHKLCKYIEDGDLIITTSIVVNTPASIPSKVIPTGFTELISITKSNSRFTVSYKVASSSDSESTITLETGTSVNNYSYVWRKLGGISSITLHDVEAQLTDTTVTNQIINTTSGTGNILAFSWTWYGSHNQDIAVDVSDLIMLNYFPSTETPVDITVGNTASGAENLLASCYFEIT